MSIVGILPSRFEGKTIPVDAGIVKLRLSLDKKNLLREVKQAATQAGRSLSSLDAIYKQQSRGLSGSVTSLQQLQRIGKDLPKHERLRLLNQQKQLQVAKQQVDQARRQIDLEKTMEKAKEGSSIAQRRQLKEVLAEMQRVLRIQQQLEKTKLQAGFAQAQKEIKGMSAQMRIAQAAAKGMGLAIKGALIGTGIGAAVVALGALTNLIGSTVGAPLKAISAYREFDSTLAQLSVVAGKTREELSPLTDEIKKVARESIRTPGEVAALAVSFSRLGFSADEAQSALQGLVQLNMAGGGNLEETGASVAAIISAFNLAAEDTTRIADLFVTAANSSGTSVAALGDAFDRVGGTAGSYSQSIDDVALALGILANNGFRDADRASTAYNQTLSQLIANSADLKEISGVDVFDIDTGDTRLLTDIVADLAVELEGLNDQQLSTVLNDLVPDKRAQKGLIALLNGLEEGNEKTIELRANLEDSGGAAQEAADKIADSSSGQLALLSGQVAGFANAFAEKVDPAVKAVFQSLGQVFDQLLNNSTLFTEIGDKAQALADRLAASPEIVESIADNVEDLIAKGLDVAVAAADKLIEFLSDDQAVEGLIDGMNDFNEGLKTALDLAQTLIGHIETAAKGLKLNMALMTQGSSLVNGLFGRIRGGAGEGDLVPFLAGKSWEDIANYSPTQGQSFTASRGNRQHNGIDYDARVGAGEGAEILAMAGGTASVISYGQNRQTGEDSVAVILKFEDEDGNRIESIAGHLSGDSVYQAIGLRPGDGSRQVRAGQSLGRVGGTDTLSSGAHLDLKLLVNGQHVNPETFLPSSTSAPSPAASGRRGRGSIPSIGGSTGSSAGGGDRAKQAYDFFISQGYSETAAAMATGVIRQESNFDPSAIGDGGRAHGLFQWHPDRRDGSFPAGDFEGQLQYAVQELAGPNGYSGFNDAMRSNDSATVQDAFDRAIRQGHTGGRYEFGSEYLSQFGSGGSGGGSRVREFLNSSASAEDDKAAQDAERARETAEREALTAAKEARSAAERLRSETDRSNDMARDAQIRETRAAEDFAISQAQAENANSELVQEVTERAADRLSAYRKFSDEIETNNRAARDLEQAIADELSLADVGGTPNNAVVEQYRAQLAQLDKSNDSLREMREQELALLDLKYQSISAEEMRANSLARSAELTDAQRNGQVLGMRLQLAETSDPYEEIKLETEQALLEIENSYADTFEDLRQRLLSLTEESNALQSIIDIDPSAQDALTEVNAELEHLQALMVQLGENRGLEQALAQIDLAQFETQRRRDFLGDIRGQGRDAQLRITERDSGVYARRRQEREMGARDILGENVARMQSARDIFGAGSPEFKEIAEQIQRIADADMSGLIEQTQTLGEELKGALGDELNDALKGLVTGTATLGETLSNLAGNLSSMLFDMAMSGIGGGGGFGGLIMSLFGADGHIPGTGIRAKNAYGGYIPNAASGNVGGIIEAAVREGQRMPAGAGLLMANTSEAVLNQSQQSALAKTLQSSSSSSGTNFNQSINVYNQGGNQGDSQIQGMGRELERAVIQIVQRNSQAGKPLYRGGK